MNRSIKRKSGRGTFILESNGFRPHRPRAGGNGFGNHRDNGSRAAPAPHSRPRRPLGAGVAAGCGGRKMGNSVRGRQLLVSKPPSTGAEPVGW
jgi:hypothetical protein